MHLPTGIVEKCMFNPMSPNFISFINWCTNNFASLHLAKVQRKWIILLSVILMKLTNNMITLSVRSIKGISEDFEIFV